MLENEVKNIAENIQDTQRDIKEVKAAMYNMPDNIIVKLDGRYALREDMHDMRDQIKTINETIEPFARLRRNLWVGFVTAVVLIALIIVAFYEFIARRTIL